tara:strand:+ start:6444 stop:6650 length:207 start_codon:yes stop_codon:yes gene_type:complete
MAKIEIKFDIDNAAFDETPLPETRRIFTEILILIERGDEKGTIKDCNGNYIGIWKIHDYQERYEEAIE